MSPYIKKFNILVGLALCIIGKNYCQTVTSTKNGLWTDPTVWDSGQVPSLATANETVINHDVIIPGGAAFSVQNVVVNGVLTLESASVVDLVTDGFPTKWDLQIFGRLVMNDGATLNGTTISNTRFESGARYVHLQGPLGFIPYATWDENSTFEIAGFRAQGYINIAHSDGWKQTFGHVIYNCTQQTTAFVDLNGNLRNIRGNFVVQSTNNQTLRLATTQNANITIGQDFIVEGPSRFWLSTTPSNAVVNVGRNFRYRSASNGISYLTTKGAININVIGEMEMNTPGRVHMASTNADSTGIRSARLTLQGHLSIHSGSMIGPPVPGKGSIIFAGTGVQTVTTPISSNPFQGTIDYIIEKDATVNLNTSLLSNAAGVLLVKGTLQVGSTDPDGAIQNANKGNVQVQGSRNFEPGSTIEYNGLAEQKVGSGHPSTPDVNLVFSNAQGVILLKDIHANNITVNGKLNAQQFAITAYGDLTMASNAECNNCRVSLSGNREQYLSASGAIIRSVTLNKSGNSVRLASSLKISGAVTIQSTNTILHSNGHLVLLSTSDGSSGTASVGPLPAGSFISGEVTVERHMAGEGRIYRYISSPVQNATVASLKDDFPVTGRFSDPSGGSTSPSLYYYNESVGGGLQAGWVPYPTQGVSGANQLVIGKGYAAYIVNGSSPTILDFTGPLNQGMIELPLDFTHDNQATNGWNLVGNPYASAIEWQASGPDKWTTENISSVIAIRDNGYAGGTFHYWDLDDLFPEIPGGQIALGQSFWVRATAANPKLVIREGVKSDGATFFRKHAVDISGFALRLSGGDTEDIAYFKIRHEAKPGIDNWDGIKMDNNSFDISTISADHISLAIQATNRFPCDTVIQIGLKDLKPGSYTLKLLTRADFLRYQFTLVDKFLGTETNLSLDEPFTLVVNSNPASYAFDRIFLKLVERIPHAGITIDGPHTACHGSVVKLICRGVDAGVTYSLWDDQTLLSVIRPTASGDIHFNFSADTLAPGKHVIRLAARTACHSSMITEHTLKIDTVPEVWADSTVICPGGFGILKAYSNRSDVEFTWFSDEQFIDTLATGYTFKTPLLSKSRRYTVVGSTLSGCKSRPITVTPSVTPYKIADISLRDETQLVSNFSMNNTWYFNGEKLKDVGPVLLLTLSGLYTLQVDTLGCVSEDSFEYVILQMESGLEELTVYPNPMNEKLFVRHAKNGIIRVELINSHGASVIRMSNDDVHSINVGQLGPGPYLAIVTTTEGNRIFRVLKCER